MGHPTHHYTGRKRVNRVKKVRKITKYTMSTSTKTSIPVLSPIGTNIPNYTPKTHFDRSKTDHVTSGYIHKVGSGVSADVYTKHNKRWVVKVYRREKIETKSDYCKRARYEYDILKLILHPNIIAVERYKVLVFTRKASLWFSGGGSVDLWKIYKRERLFEPQEAKCFWRQICAGVEYLHRQGWCHRDIKPENCVLDAEGTVKIIDFATATSTERPALGLVGSQRYAAPETMLQISYAGAAADAWSLGIVLHWLLNGLFPWKIASRDDPSFQKYCQSDLSQIDSRRDSDLVRGLWTLLVPQPSQRPAVVELQSHQWYKSVPFCLKLDQASNCGIDHRILSARHRI